VVRRTSKHRLQACLPDNALDYTHRHAQVIKDRSLFDMKLDVTEHARSDLGFVEAVGVQTKIANCLSHRDSAIILNLECISVQRADECPAAQKGNMEADALFFGKRDNLDAELRRFTVESFDTQTEADAALLSGRADVGWLDTPVAYYQVQLKGGKLKIVGTTCGVAPYGIAMLHSSGLQQATEDAVKYLIDHGFYKKILDSRNAGTGAIASSDVGVNINSSTGAGTDACVPTY